MKLRNIIYPTIIAGIGAGIVSYISRRNEVKKNPAKDIHMPFESDLASTAEVPLNDSSESYDSDLASRIVEFSENPHNSEYL